MSVLSLVLKLINGTWLVEIRLPENKSCLAQNQEAKVNQNTKKNSEKPRV